MGHQASDAGAPYERWMAAGRCRAHASSGRLEMLVRILLHVDVGHIILMLLNLPDQFHR